MNRKQKELVKKLSEEVLRKFPKVRVEGVWEKGDGSVALKVVTPEDNGMQIVEALSPLVYRIFQEYGYDIHIMPLERITALDRAARN